MLRITCIEANLLYILNSQGSLVDDIGPPLSKGLFHEGVCTATRYSNSSCQLLFTTLRVMLQRATCILRFVTQSALNGESCMPIFFFFFFFCMMHELSTSPGTRRYSKRRKGDGPAENEVHDACSARYRSHVPRSRPKVTITIILP